MKIINGQIQEITIRELKCPECGITRMIINKPDGTTLFCKYCENKKVNPKDYKTVMFDETLSSGTGNIDFSKLY